MALVYSCAIHVATDTGTFDQSTLKSVNPMQKPLRRGRALGRAAHLPLVTFRPPQAAALSVKIGNKAGGTEGKEPSLHMDAFASILRPLSPYPVAHYSPSDRGATAPQGRHSGERG